jgi:hypothetical protein
VWRPRQLAGRGQDPSRDPALGFERRAGDADPYPVRAALMVSVANINDVLEGHVALEIECVDRLYLNAYAPNLLVGG